MPFDLILLLKLCSKILNFCLFSKAYLCYLANLNCLEQWSLVEEVTITVAHNPKCSHSWLIPGLVKQPCLAPLMVFKRDLRKIFSFAVTCEQETFIGRLCDNVFLVLCLSTNQFVPCDKGSTKSNSGAVHKNQHTPHLSTWQLFLSYWYLDFLPVWNVQQEWLTE